MPSCYKRLFFVSILLFICTTKLRAQSSEEATKSESFLDKTHIGGYGEITYTKPNGSGAARLDLPRFVIYLDHYFSDRWAFKSETEIEHVKLESGTGGEVALEQAFLDYHCSRAISWRVGLMLIPVGIINQTHEPNTFYSVERPLLDQDVIPTTWREIGTGLYGDLADGVRYQLYVTEGLNGRGITMQSLHDAKQEGSSPEGLGSNATHPAISARLDFLPVAGLRIGLSGYYQAVTLDSLTENISAPLGLVALDARFETGVLRFRGEGVYVSRGDAQQIAQAQLNDEPIQLSPARIAGGYIEAAVNILPLFSSAESELLPFVRYESFKFTLPDPPPGFSFLATQPAARTAITAGIAFKPLDNVILKADYRSTNSDDVSEKGRISLGAGYSF